MQAHIYADTHGINIAQNFCHLVMNKSIGYASGLYNSWQGYFGHACTIYHKMNETGQQMILSISSILKMCSTLPSKQYKLFFSQLFLFLLNNSCGFNSLNKPHRVTYKFDGIEIQLSRLQIYNL